MPKLPRVLHVTRIAKGGVAVVSDQIARGLQATNQYELVVVFDTPQDSDIRKQLVASPVQTIELVEARDVLGEQMASRANQNNTGTSRVERYLGKKGYPIYLSMKSAWTFLLRELPRVKVFYTLIKKNKISLVHTHSDLRRAKPEVIAAKLAGVPCVTHRHGYATYTWFDTLFAGLVAKNIYISKDIAQYHVAQGEKQAKAEIIHNGIAPADYARTFDIQKIRHELGCSLSQPLIGLVARLDWWKGHEFFIEAMAEVVQQYKHCKGLIIGGIAELDYHRSKKYLDTLHEMVQSLGLRDHMVFTGHRNDIPRLVSALEVVVHASSIPEPFGLTVIEGMAAGKPVVATAAGGVLDIIEDGKNGLLVPCQDAKAMARAIMLFLADYDKARQMGEAAQQRVAENFTMSKQMTAVHLLYTTLLDQS